MSWQLSIKNQQAFFAKINTSETLIQWLFVKIKPCDNFWKIIRECYLDTWHSTETLWTTLLFEERTWTLSKILWRDLFKCVCIIFRRKKYLQYFVALCILTKTNNRETMQRFTFMKINNDHIYYIIWVTWKNFVGDVTNKIIT